jgi:1,2-phenylacetyl-CoA epoxidase catalytic subunit
VAEEISDVHALDPAAFLEEVHSFEFWFEAVQGYLTGLDHGHRPDTGEVEFSEPERDRLITVLCNYCIGETAALEGSGGLIQIAPNRAAKVFLATQTVDEGRHLEVLIHRLGELGIEDAEGEIARRGSRSLLEFKRRLMELVTGRDWAAAIFAQNIILESMEFAVFHRHAREADPRTREMLTGIIKDERRHIGFGENELGRRLREAPHTRDRLVAVRQELDALVLHSFEETMDQVGAPRAERADLGRQYLQAVERLGFGG